jgi:2-dehydropantoate 2-reductase
VAVDLKVGIIGAGAIGCYLGGRLAAAGCDVVFVGRARTSEELATHGLTLTDLEGARVHVPAPKITVFTQASSLEKRDVVLCCVKSAQTEAVADDLAQMPGPLVVSMQNGLRNPEILRRRLGEGAVLAGIVSFNVVSQGEGTFRRATTGPLVVERSADPRARSLTHALRAAGFAVAIPNDIRAVQWSKLLMNLNNAVSALTDLPTREILFRSDLRRVLAALIEEALGVMRAAGIRPARLGAVPAEYFPSLLRLPTPIFRLLARAQLQVDPEARSSMWEDLARGRRTEVDWLNGEVVRLAESCGARAPMSQRVVELVHEVEAKGEGSPRMSAERLRRELAAPPVRPARFDAA